MAQIVTRQNIRCGVFTVYNNRVGNFVFAKIVAIGNNGRGEPQIALKQGDHRKRYFALSRLRSMKARIVSEDEFLRRANTLGRCFIDMPDPVLE